MIISITGGLGNQLFQLYAGIFYGQGKVRLSTKFGNPRMTNGIPDIMHFSLPKGVEILEERSRDKLAQKIGGFALRRNLIPSTYDSNLITRKVIDISMKAYFSTKLRERVSIFSAHEVGLNDKRPGINDLVFGYFQSTLYWESVKDLESGLTLKNYSNRFLEFRNHAEKERPLVVHVRLGDYVQEEHFGLLSREYYIRGLNHLNSHSSKKQIWLFSDEPEKAKSFLKTEIKDNLFLVPKAGLTPAETLELMRYGSGYVIANSSFSWWGASLSYNHDSKVVAPSKWFAGMSDPQAILPENWIREDR